MRVILYTGKGGVGKTSMAAATACKLAESGKKVLIMSTDQAHSLSDSFDEECGREPVRIADNLDAMEIDSIYESEQNWERLKNYMKRLLTSKGNGGIEVEELLVFPGLEELFSMLRVLNFVEEGDYDVIILDCAPTGETLSLLKYPEMLSNFIDKIMPVKRKAVKVARPVVEKTMKIPMPEDNVFDDIERIVGRLGALQKLLLNKEVVSVRIVTTPEQIVISEAQRNFTCMHLYNYNVDAIIVNKIYKEEAMEGYFSKWIEKQEQGLKRINEVFSEVPKFYMYLQEKEIVGVEYLKKIGESLWKSEDVSAILFSRKIYEKDENDHTLSIYLPSANKEDLDLGVLDNEIILSYKNETRRFPMPVKWSDCTLSGAKFEKDYLIIKFEK